MTNSLQSSRATPLGTVACAPASTGTQIKKIRQRADTQPREMLSRAPIPRVAPLIRDRVLG
jgi:hypothetical protein